jgi:large subunit ribosomal protein L17
MNGLGRSLILHSRIKTTEPKAKELRPFIEKLITKGKRATVANRRAISALIGPEAGKRLVDEVSIRYKDAKGGYTRIVKLARRKSDGASMASIELI